MLRSRRQLAILVGAVLLSSPAIAGEAARRTIAVHGSAELRAAPDILRLVVVFRAEGPAVEALRRDVDNRARRFTDSLDRFGIDSKHYSALQPTVEPQYVWDKKRKLTGFIYRRQVQIELNKIDHYGDLIDQALKLGAEMSGAPVMDFSDREALEVRALEAAVVAARAKAQRLAAAAGASLGPVQEIVETSATPVPRPMMMATRMAETADVAVEHVGEQTIRRTVQVRFALR
ncbi:MAG: DUF541 domain-containing protein [Candidatus Dadabacteria bacterium]|nr:MAG: DUF541 domain-containing protein [Candidatus Dadabacteria bacterium]